MKKTNLFTPLLFGAILTGSIFINFSCKKDRVEPTEPLNEYASLNDYLDSKKQEEQEFIITGPSLDTIVGNQGTKIFGAKNCLNDANGDTIDYPYSIKLVELYTPADMIYYQMPTISSGNLMESDGEIRLRAFKDTEELTLKASCPYGILMPNSAPKSTMTIFNGFDNGNFVNWTNTTIPFSTTSYGYLGYINNLGWINCGNLPGLANEHVLKFESLTDDLTNVKIFIYLPDTKTVMQVYDEASGALPNGVDVKIVLMAIDSNGDLFSYTESRTVNSKATIDVTLSKTTDADLTAHLNSL